jgi:hypothetical protein
MSWQAQKWAWRQNIRPASVKFVLLAYADHANDDGYSWPSKELIASDTGLDIKTVAGALGAILVRRVLTRAKTRSGKTGRVLGLRFPKSCRVITPKTVGLKRTPNPPAILQQSSSNPTNLGSVTRNQEPGTNPEKRAEGSSLPSLGNGPLAGSLTSFLDSFSSSSKEEIQEPTWHDEIRGMYPGTTVDKDLKQIEEWARKKRKKFTRDLALNALRRNPPKKPGQHDGYVYHGKFIGNREANAFALKNPELLLNAKRAIRHVGGRIEIL